MAAIDMKGLHMKHWALVLTLATAMGSATAQPVACQRGVNHFQAERFAEAIPSLTECLSVDLPPQVQAAVYEARSVAYRETKQWGLAAADQQAVIQRIPAANAWPYITLGAYLREDGRYDEALAALRRARDFDEDGPGTGPGMAVYYHTAKTLHLAGRHQEAVEAMTLGIPKQPDYGYALYQRALSYEVLGDSLQAKRDLFRAAELVPQDGYEPEIAAKLKAYGFDVKVRAE